MYKRAYLGMCLLIALSGYIAAASTNLAKTKVFIAFAIGTAIDITKYTNRFQNSFWEKKVESKTFHGGIQE